MFSKFTERARQVLSLAQEEALKLGHNYVGTEHLLLGLVRDGDGIAARVLGSLGLTEKSVRAHGFVRYARQRDGDRIELYAAGQAGD